MAMGNRKKAEEYMLKVVKDGDPTGRTLQLVKEQLAKMDDKRFHEFVQRVKEGKEFIPLIVDAEYDKVWIMIKLWICVTNTGLRSCNVSGTVIQ